MTLQTPDLVLATYGNKMDVISLSQRIKIMVPGGNKLTDSEAQALAQVSLVTTCNPFIGEIWYIPGRGPMIGIKGARRHGNEQIEKAGGLQAYWTADLHPCSGEDAGYKGDTKDLAAAYKCTITDSVSTMGYQKMILETIAALRAGGSQDPVGEAREICGTRPQWIGYGFATVSEQSKMNKQALAMKRAEADGLKRKFDIPFGADVAGADSASEAETPEWINGTATSAKPDGREVPQTVSPVVDLMTYQYASAVKFTSPIGEIELGTMDAENLNKIYLSDKTSDEQKQAIALILKHDFSMEPPKRSQEQNLKELGY